MKTNWQTKKLGDLVSIVTGKLDANAAIDGGKFPFYTCSKEDSQIEETAFDGESILLSGNGIFSVKYHKSGKFNAYQRVYVIQNKNEEVYLRYIYFLLEVEVPKLTSQGGVIRYLRLPQLTNLEIPLPPLATQRQIVALLDERFAKLREVKQLRQEAIMDTEKVLATTLREIFEEGKEKGWGEKTLRDACEKVISINPEKEFDDKFLYIDIGSVHKGVGVRPYEIFTTGNIPSRARRPIQINDVLFALTRPYLKNIAIVDKEYKDAVASTGFCVLRTKKDILNSRYLYYIVTSDEFMAKIIPLQKGATYPAVNESHIFIQEILVPPLAEQQKIVMRLDVLSEKLRTLHELQRSQLEDIKKLEKAYLREAFRGELI